MKCWKSNFKKTPLKQGIKYKDSVENVNYDGKTFKTTISSKDKYDVELIIQDDILFDMNCTCSKKSPCAHEAAALYFLEEFPEILEDFDEENVEKIAKININDDLKVISEKNLIKFIKKEFRKNPKLKYNFIKHFSEESLIDKKEYEKKLKRIIRRGKERGFSYHGYYNLNKISSDLKRFLKKDIMILINQHEYELAYQLLNEIMDNFIDPIYRADDAWYEIALYYREYCEILQRIHKFSTEQKDHMDSHFRIINNIVL